MHVHIGFVIAEIERYGCKARGADRLEQSGEKTVQLGALRVTGDEGQFPKVCELDVLKEVGNIGCPQLAWNAARKYRAQT